MKQISQADYLMGRAKFDDLDESTQDNINTLLPKVNELLKAFGTFRGCNSGFRSKADQMRINPKATSSKHLTGAAIDLEDANGKLKAWINANVSVLERLGLYCEDFGHTTTWVHCQIFPPKSGRRFFIP